MEMPMTESPGPARVVSVKKKQKRKLLRISDLVSFSQEESPPKTIRRKRQNQSPLQPNWEPIVMLAHTPLSTVTPRRSDLDKLKAYQQTILQGTSKKKVAPKRKALRSVETEVKENDQNVSNKDPPKKRTSLKSKKEKTPKNIKQTKRSSSENEKTDNTKKNMYDCKVVVERLDPKQMEDLLAKQNKLKRKSQSRKSKSGIIKVKMFSPERLLALKSGSSDIHTTKTSVSKSSSKTSISKRSSLGENSSRVSQRKDASLNSKSMLELPVFIKNQNGSTIESESETDMPLYSSRDDSEKLLRKSKEISRDLGINNEQTAKDSSSMDRVKPKKKERKKWSQSIIEMNLNKKSLQPTRNTKSLIGVDILADLSKDTENSMCISDVYANKQILHKITPSSTSRKSSTKRTSLVDGTNWNVQDTEEVFSNSKIVESNQIAKENSVKVFSKDEEIATCHTPKAITKRRGTYELDHTVNDLSILTTAVESSNNSMSILNQTDPKSHHEDETVKQRRTTRFLQENSTYDYEKMEAFMLNSTTNKRESIKVTASKDDQSTSDDTSVSDASSLISEPSKEKDNPDGSVVFCGILKPNGRLTQTLPKKLAVTFCGNMETSTPNSFFKSNNRLKQKRSVTFNDQSVIVIEDVSANSTSSTSPELIDKTVGHTPLPRKLRSTNSTIRFSSSEKKTTIVKSANSSKRDLSSASNKEKSIRRTPARSKMPDFTKIHEKLFRQMEDIKEHSKRKADRAKLLLSGNKVPPLPKNQKEAASKKKLFSKLPVAIKPTDSRKAEIKAKEVAKTVFGFNVVKPLNSPKIDKIRAVANKVRVPKKITSANRAQLAGVRVNRRFELLMAMRSKNM